MNQVPYIPQYTPLELRQRVHSSVCGVDLDFPDRASPSWTVFGGLSLGAVDVFRVQGTGVRLGYRTPFHIREDGIDDFLISMPRSARVTLAQLGRSVCLQPGTFALYSTRQPGSFEITPGTASDPFELTHVRISGALLRQCVPHIDACCLRSIEVRPGAVRIMQSLIDAVLNEGWALTEAQIRPFSQLLMDAVANFVNFAPELADLTTAAASSVDKAKLAAQAYIAEHLTEPDLNLAEIARHCGVSVRYLHKIFATSGQTVSDFIRDSRLAQCRKSLQTPALLAKSVTEIALMWGFNDSSSFGRAYKTKYGVVPSRDRRAFALAH